jgi:predicted transcriptional regulator
VRGLAHKKRRGKANESTECPKLCRGTHNRLSYKEDQLFRRHQLTAMPSILWSKVHMETIQVVLDKSLLQATDRAARRMKLNRSALIREALREHLRRLEVPTSEERDREGYSRQPQTAGESSLWQAEAAWPAE